MEEVRENLSEHQPRYLVYSFKQDHGDGRISYPMCFVFVSPEGELTAYIKKNEHIDLTLFFHDTAASLVAKSVTIRFNHTVVLGSCPSIDIKKITLN